MKYSELKTKSEKELNDELRALLKEQFNLRMQRSSGEAAPRSHNFRVVRRNIARLKTALNEKINEKTN